MSRIAKQLQTAVADANADEAARLVEQLAQSRSRIRVYADPETSLGSGDFLSSTEDSVIVRVTFQVGVNRLSRPVRLVLPRVACVADLKAETLMSFDLPQEIQRCIVNNRLARDEETLGDIIDEAPTQNNSNLDVRTYLLTHDANLWPPEKEHLESLKNAVLAEKQKRSTLAATPDEGSAGSIEQPAEEEQEPGWNCTFCATRNVPTRPGCSECGTARPDDYVVPQELLKEEQERQARLEQEFLAQMAQERQHNMNRMLTLANDSIIRMDENQVFECPICLIEIGGDEDELAGVRGIRLRECGHEVCSNCLKDHVMNADSLPILCPCDPCQQTVTDAELAALLTPEELARVQRIGLRQAEGVIKNAFHCVTPNCEGFVELVDEINEFNCQVCQEHNCVTCKASHKGQGCKEYQEEMQRIAQNDENARQGLLKLEEMITTGEAMRCPQCKVLIQKKEGCDWIMCSVCKTEICWATKGPRWGPKGKGDTSGGCRCHAPKKCHPQCMNCH